MCLELYQMLPNGFSDWNILHSVHEYIQRRGGISSAAILGSREVEVGATDRKRNPHGTGMPLTLLGLTRGIFFTGLVCSLLSHLGHPANITMPISLQPLLYFMSSLSHYSTNTRFPLVFVQVVTGVLTSSTATPPDDDFWNKKNG